jgi:hypothetical protein
MRKVSLRVLKTLVAAGLLVAAAPAIARGTGSNESKDCRKELKRLKNLTGFCGKKGYAHYHYELMKPVTENLEKSNTEAAEKLFRKAIKEAKRDHIGKHVLPDMFAVYAQAIAKLIQEKASETNKYTLRDQLQKTLAEGRKYALKNQTTSSTRLTFLVEAIEIFEKAGMKTEAGDSSIALDDALQKLEGKENLSSEERKNIASTLIKHANTFCNAPVYPYAHHIGDREIFVGTSIEEVDEEQFKKAEGYQIRALAQYDKLDDSDRSRIEAHRDIIRWYRLHGKTAQEKCQTEILGQLLHTTAPEKLFPQRRTCLGCGMG